MRHIIFSDLHNNYFALREFYKYLLSISDEIKLYFLGDIIGYYKFDVRIIELLKVMINKWNMDICIGNHDAAFFNHLGLTEFKIKFSNSLNETIKSNYKHKKKIMELFSNINFNQLDIKINTMHYTLSHGGISDIINDYFYPDLSFIKWSNYKFRSGMNYICGHTHRPFIKTVKDNIFINVGSLGMPRDGDPRMCFLEINNNNLQIMRRFYNMDLLYDYNFNLNNNIRNRIYMGGNSKYIHLNLLSLNEEKIYVESIFNNVFFFDRCIYVIYKNCLFQILKLAYNGKKYLLRFQAQEILSNNIQNLIRRIKYEML
ncbi:metallophosphoesterase family protein [Clostridium lundense]|uniref:metallophosphoesterase family protein n=1 Tax=Clostridium lundense TaxID=319475 RepID=UPI000483DE7C|nr:metallophosphoesterase family protein [Clostridium lundense]